MNNTRLTTRTISTSKLAHHRLRVWEESRKLVRLVHGAPLENTELRNQASRASLSVGLNIAEGAALEGGAKKRHYKIARGSVVEVVAAYELGQDLGFKVPLRDVQELGAVIASMLSGLILR